MFGNQPVEPQQTAPVAYQRDEGARDYSSINSRGRFSNLSLTISGLASISAEGGANTFCYITKGN
jgi:hypothetical protein